MKRILALFLAMLMALSLIPAAAAEDVGDIEIIETEDVAETAVGAEDLITVVEPEEAPEEFNAYDKPVILAQSEDVKVSVGYYAHFYVTDTNGEDYQWQYRTSSSGSWNTSTAEGAKSPELTIKGTLARNGYQYRCKVSNDKGYVYSKAMTLTVTELPVVTLGMDEWTVPEGYYGTFYADATGADSLQWYYRTGSSGSWIKMDGETTDHIKVKLTEDVDGYQYRCKATNSKGSVYSETLTLHVTAKPVIGWNPEDVAAQAGTDVRFYAWAYGKDLSFQWYWRSSASGSWNKCTGASAVTESLWIEATAARNGYQYRCKITNSAGSVYSEPATLTVTDMPSVVDGPYEYGEHYVGEKFTFTVNAEGAESYQWYYRTSTNGSWNKSSAAGAKTQNLTVEATMARNGYQYRCKITNSKGYVYSDTVTLRVTDKPVIHVMSADITTCPGNTASFTVQAVGAESYQWYWRSSESGSWNKSTAAGAKTDRLEVEATMARNGYQYYCKVTNAKGSTDSNVMTLKVSELPVIQYGPWDQKVSVGRTAYFQVSATGAESYQWYWRSSPSGSWNKSTAESATTDQLQVEATAARNGYQYRCKVTNSKGSVYSDVATLLVTNKPTLDGRTGDITAAPGNAVEFRVWAYGQDLSYQWYWRSSASGSWNKSTAAGATTDTLEVEATTARNGYQYRCLVSNQYGSVYSDPMTLTVTELPIINYGPWDLTASIGTETWFHVEAENADSYQWYWRSSESGSWNKSTAAGATTDTLEVEATMERNGYQYRCKITNSKGSVYSATATLTVQREPIVYGPYNTTASAGSTVHFEVYTNGGTSFQWYWRSGPSGTWNKCTGDSATTDTLEVKATTARNGYQYRCKVSNEYASVYSQIATLTVISGNAYSETEILPIR